MTEVTLAGLCDTEALVVALCERLCPSMNSPPARRLTMCLMDLSVLGSIPSPDDDICRV